MSSEGVVRLVFANHDVWTVRDVVRIPSGSHRRFVPLGEPTAFEREFTPRDPSRRSRRYRFRDDSDRRDDLETIVRELYEAREVG